MQSLERATMTLRVVASKGPSGAKLADVAEATGLSRSTAHRFLGALVQVGLLEQDESSATYFLGMELAHFGAIATNRFGLRDVAHASLARLTERTADTIYMSIRRGYDSICIERFEGDYPIKTLTLDVGDRRPLGVGAGSLALLAFQSDEFVSRAIAVNAAAVKANWGFSSSELFEFVAETRRKGFAFNPGRVAPGMTALGVAIRGVNNDAVAAIGVGAITSRMTPERCANIVTWMHEEAREIEAKLSHLAGPLTQQAMRRLTRSGARAR
ncbi:MAG: IclR family transcriptional regulator [Parvibaculaceae bacterium]